MFSIGVFARLGEISVRTLRFYDERGLIKPAHTDPQTGYRYYHARQIPRLLRILALRELGFSLEEIAGVLNASFTTDAFGTLLRQKRDELQDRLRKDTETLVRIEARIQTLYKEQAATMTQTYEVATKSVPSVLVASIQSTIPNWEMVTPTLNTMFDNVTDYIHTQGGTITGPGFDRWLDTEMKNEDMHVEACMPVAKPLAETAIARTYELPGIPLVAWTMHRGSFEDGLSVAHRTVVEWIEKSGYRIAGPGREIYHIYDRTSDRSEWLTEIQYPVERI